MSGTTSNFTPAVASATAAESVTDAFGLIGAGTVRVTHHLTEDQGITYRPARHKAGAVGAADGYLRVTGRPGVSLVTWGPAVTNTVTALTTALRAGSPLVLDCVITQELMPSQLRQHLTPPPVVAMS
jgi:thiamine pyrophosphate-dependent acetolactate synthase large subunit-like protein